MNKLVRLIYVNLIENLNINMVSESKRSNARDSSEVKLVILGVLGVVFGILLYKLYDYLGYWIANKHYLLVLSFVISSIVVFMSNVVSMEDTLFRSNDVEMLYSLPLTKGQIVLSKIFNVYIKNVVFVAIINIPAILVYSSFIKVTDLVGLLYLLFSLIVPLIPIVITALLSYGNAYIKARRDKKLLFNLIRLLVIGFFVLILFVGFKDVTGTSFDEVFGKIFKRLSIFYPLINMVSYSLRDGNAFYVFLGLVLPIYIFYVFILFLANNYIRLISILKGVRVNNKFILGDPKNYGKIRGLIRKEIRTVLHDKVYFMHTVGLQIMGTFLVIAICLVNPLEKFSELENINYIYNLMMPSFVACASSLCCTTISSLSLERDNLATLKALPISFRSLLINKVITNIIISLPLTIVNVLCMALLTKTNGIVLLVSFIYSLFTILFISILGITLDLRFIDNKEKSRNVIIKQRLITFIPLIVSAIIVFYAIVSPIYAKYYYVVSSYALLEFVGSIICVSYLIINNKTLIDKIQL